MTNTDPMPCGNTCGSCVFSSLCHSDEVDVDPAEVAARILDEREVALAAPAVDGTPSLFAVAP